MGGYVKGGHAPIGIMMHIERGGPLGGGSGVQCSPDPNVRTLDVSENTSLLQGYFFLWLFALISGALFCWIWMRASFEGGGKQPM